ncbi:MAG: thioredoxin [Planctomycetes bacterium]|nr:thioredoxin [Planctomycetota bacterium]
MAESVVEITDSNFEGTVLKASQPALVDFWASWCGPCRAVAPVVEQLAQEYKGRAIVGKINLDDQQEVATRYGIMRIPTVLIFKGGQPVEQFVGVMNKTVYASALDKHLQ